MISLVEVSSLSKEYVQWTNRPPSLKRLLVDLFRGPGALGRLNKVTVFQDLNFRVGPGEFVGIMGRNGCGKSTLLKILSGILGPTSGSAIVRGTVAPLLELGAGFVPDLSGRENVYLNAAILGFSRIATELRLAQIIEFSELGDKIDMPVKHYSSGMIVRLGFSVAVHLDAEILFFDEVLAVGDVGFQKKCLKKINDLNCEGRAILLVSHSPEQVLQNCTRVIVLADQKIKFDGDVREGVKVYESLFEAAP